MDKIADLEGRAAAAAALRDAAAADSASFGPPSFETLLENVECAEGDVAVFEAKVQPAADPSLQIGEMISRYHQHIIYKSVLRSGVIYRDFAFRTVNIENESFQSRMIGGLGPYFFCKS